jgi:RNA polymerase sigma-70 factor (ECF subfamily)
MREADATPTELLLAWSRGDQRAFDRLVPIVHGELLRLARRYMAAERRDHTLQPTALVNEAYLRLIQLTRIQWQSRTHFLAMAARVMRRVLVDAARAHRNVKRGGAAQKISIEEALLVSRDRPRDVVALDDALQALEAAHPRQGRAVELRFFGGLEIAEIAHVLDVSADTAKRDLRFAKLYLLRTLAGDSP